VSFNTYEPLPAQGVSRLGADGIEVTAMHQHPIDEQRRVFNLRFWPNDDPAKLANGPLVALDQTSSARGQLPTFTVGD
jgi:hypothetical protein